MLRRALLMVLSMSVAAAGQGKDRAPEVDRIVVIKSSRIMGLYSRGTLVKTYLIALGRMPIGAKDRQGDHKTPEGVYTIDYKNDHSQFYLALHISYPNAKDREKARLRHVNPGGAIMIHGLPPAFASIGVLHRQIDWTEGCVAVTDKEIEEIWSLVPVGTTIEIKP